VDAEFFRRREVHPGQFGIPADRFVLGFIANRGSNLDNGRKGIDILLSVIREVAARIPRLHVVLGGPGWEKELANLQAAGISASATGYIRQSDLPALYSALDVYLLTSRVEGGPCTVFEAMACETAVVSTRVGAVPELIVDGMNGYSTNVDDREALVSAIVALEKFPEDRIKIARNGKETVTKRAWASALSPLEGVYDELPLPGPDWMNDPQELLRASCAADALLNVIPRVRKGSISTVKGIRLLFEMLNKPSIVDIVKGVAMVRGVSFKSIEP
jgi:hypothetical protein